MRTSNQLHFFLHTARKGGSLTSYIGASSNGNSPTSKLPILTKTLIMFSKFKKTSFFIDVKISNQSNGNGK